MNKTLRAHLALLFANLIYAASFTMLELLDSTADALAATWDLQAGAAALQAARPVETDPN